MEDFSVNLTVNDCCRNKCNTVSNTTTNIFDSLNNFLSLNDNYYFKLIDVEDTYIVISIDNGSVFFVRKAYINIPIRICLPEDCCCQNHLVTIIVNSITN